MDKAKMNRILGQVGKPVRYMGNEYNMVVKDPSEVLINFAFAFPDVYEVGDVPSRYEATVPPDK